MPVMRGQAPVPFWELLAWLDARGIKLVDRKDYELFVELSPVPTERLRALVDQFGREYNEDGETFDRREAARLRSESGDTLDASRPLRIPGPYSDTGVPS